MLPQACQVLALSTTECVPRFLEAKKNEYLVVRVNLNKAFDVILHMTKGNADVGLTSVTHFF